MNQISLAQTKIRQDSIPAFFMDDNSSECWVENFGSNKKPSIVCTCNNADVAKIIGSNNLWPSGNLGLNITGLNLNQLSIWDGGLVRHSHYEFNNRSMQMDGATSLSSHATSVAGNMIAQGLNPKAKGMAYQTQLKAFDFSNDNAEIIAFGSGLLASNHSYAHTCAWTTIGGNLYWYGDSAKNQFKDWKFGYYDNRSKIWDSMMFVNPYYQMVKAAGNDRGNGVAPGTTHYYWNGTAWALTNTTRDTVGPYDCVSTFGCGKNVITVGACNLDTSSNNFYPLSFSSFGPTDDGRIKPDLVAPSGTIFTTGSANDSFYTTLGGTSMSAPTITGSIILLQQHAKNVRGNYLYNGLIKALILNSCKSGNANLLGPNYSTGWGLPRIDIAAQTINTYNAFNTKIAESLLLNQSDSVELSFYHSQVDTTKITIAWVDKEAVVGPEAYNDTTLKLVSDLDMKIFQNANLIKEAFVLNPYNPTAAPTTGNNFRDNVEQVVLTSQNADGFYTLKIKHKGQLYNQQQLFGFAATNAVFQPLVQAKNLVITNKTNTSLQLNFTKGGGEKRLVIASTNPITQLPLNGLNYLANDTFGFGANLGQNHFVVYNDTGSAVQINGLNFNTMYYLAVIEYNGLPVNKLVYQTNTFGNTSNTTLPVKLTNFKANYLYRKVYLNWQTSSEINNRGFYVLRSLNSIDFSEIGFVYGAGNSFTTRNYTFIDSLFEVDSTKPITIYYKLKPTDFNGIFSYTKTISILVEPTNSLVIYPNPFKDGFNILFFTELEEKFSIEFYKITGELIANLNYQTVIGYNTFYCEALKNQPEGLYFMKIQTNGINKMIRIIKSN